MSRRALKVALIMGGTSSEREVSLKSGRTVAKALEALPHTVEVFDPATDLAALVNRASEFDVALVMLHGAGGEDGRLQGLLDLLGLPYQCAGVLGCALAMDKPGPRSCSGRRASPWPRTWCSGAASPTRPAGCCGSWACRW